ncbi:MAG: outer membrane protein assembly factor BamD [Deltaproteobacteria bacterium]|nr:outer membrane protein assembly factor BamD [Deltaproteobacteria bacterium]
MLSLIAAISRFKLKRLFPILVLLVFAGCGSVEVVGTRDPKELYDTAMTAYYREKFEESEKIFKTLMEEYPLSPYSVEAQLMLGDACYAQEKYDESSSYYTNFVALHPTHQKAAYAMFQKGMSHFRDVLTIDRDQTATKKALFAFQDLVSTYPDSPYFEKSKEFITFLKKRLAEREFYIAYFYYKDKNYKGALSRLRDILKEYPEAGLADKTLFYIGESYSRLGEKRLADDAFTNIITNFPESPFAKNAKSRLKQS